MIHWGHILSELVEQVERQPNISKSTLHFNDRLIIKTQNSVYTIISLGQNDVLVFGGWFDKRGLTPYHTQINGCTWGGSILKQDIIASCGMCIEFANRVTTSSVQEILFFPTAGLN